MHLFVLTLVLLAVIAYFFQNKPKRKSPTKIPFGKVPIPFAGGSLPFFGHALAIFKDANGCLKTCYKRHGPVFKFKFFQKTIVAICDRELSHGFFKASEDQMSLYDFLEQIYLSDAFSSGPKFSLEQAANLTKKTIETQFDSFIPKIEEQAHRMIQRLKDHVAKHDGQKIDLTHEITRFVVATSASCFMGAPLPDDIFQSLQEFIQLLKHSITLAFMFPNIIVRFLVQSRLSKIRKRITKYLEPEIEKYLQDPNKSDSLVLRAAADSVHEDTGNKFSNEDIGNFMICLLYISTINSSTGAVNLLVDLACNLSDWDRFKKEAERYLVKENNVHGLLRSDFLNACVMETARMNSNPLALIRAPMEGQIALGKFYLDKDVDGVAVCSSMLQMHSASEDLFSNPGVYNPSRFLKTGNKELMGPKSIMSWGAGHHLCPGKIFAIYEIKIALALFVLNFKFDVEAAKIRKIQYSSSALMERKVYGAVQTI